MSFSFLFGLSKASIQFYSEQMRKYNQHVTGSNWDSNSLSLQHTCRRSCNVIPIKRKCLFGNLPLSNNDKTVSQFTFFTIVLIYLVCRWWVPGGGVNRLILELYGSTKSWHFFFANVYLRVEPGFVHPKLLLGLTIWIVSVWASEFQLKMPHSCGPWNLNLIWTLFDRKSLFHSDANWKV